MIEVIKYPGADLWHQYMKRATDDTTDEVRQTVARVFDEVRAGGDEALRQLTLEFDRRHITDLRVGEEVIAKGRYNTGTLLAGQMDIAARNIEAFHRAQIPGVVEVETMPGVKCWQRAVPITRVGLYIPGGNAPLFSTVLMLALPARIAGCKEVVLCTPPRGDGSVHPAILCAARMAGVSEIYRVGGAQAIAAMAVGTESIRPVSKIFGPGNRYVTEAKLQASTMGVAIDMPAGPSEVMVVADEQADTRFVALDLLSQAEHGPDSQSILLTTSERLAQEVAEALDELVWTIPKRTLAQKSLENSHIIVLGSDDEMMQFANQYAPEHLILNHSRAEQLAQQVVNAGSVFLGPYSPESAGDYVSGTNHTLPTCGYARSYSGVNIDSFMKKITFQHLTRDGIASLEKTIRIMARSEELVAHSLAAEERIKRR